MSGMTPLTALWSLFLGLVLGSVIIFVLEGGSIDFGRLARIWLIVGGVGAIVVGILEVAHHG